MDDTHDSLLSLKWSKHRSTFFHMLSTAVKKKSYTDVTLVCDGKFYKVHKLILSTCSDYFEKIFDETTCEHPIIILNGIGREEVEYLLHYMYVGEVNVVHDKLASLIKAAEYLRIKGLAVPDGEEINNKTTSSSGTEKRNRSDEGNNSFDLKRRKYETDSEWTSNLRTDTTSKQNTAADNDISSDEDDSTDNFPSQQFPAVEVGKVEMTEYAEAIPTPDVCISDVSSIAVKDEPRYLDEAQLSDSNQSGFSNTKSLLLEQFVNGALPKRIMDHLLESDQGQLVDCGGEKRLPSCTSSLQMEEQQEQLGCQQIYFYPGNVEKLHQLNPEMSGHPIVDPSSQSSTSRGTALTDNYSLARSGCHNNDFLAADGSIIPSFGELELPLKNFHFICPVCNKLFHHKGTFRRHYMIHSGEKPYSCPHCCFKTRTTGNLNNHICNKH